MPDCNACSSALLYGKAKKLRHRLPTEVFGQGMNGPFSTCWRFPASLSIHQFHDRIPGIPLHFGSVQNGDESRNCKKYHDRKKTSPAESITLRYGNFYRYGFARSPRRKIVPGKISSGSDLSTRQRTWRYAFTGFPCTRRSPL